MAGNAPDAQNLAEVDARAERGRGRRQARRTWPRVAWATICVRNSPGATFGVLIALLGAQNVAAPAPDA